jgi:polysaccharide biosynthesis/export protein
VFGQVKNPGAYSVQKKTTVLQALSLAGGVNEHGAMNRIQIMRIENGTKKEVRVQLTDVVRPEDTIIVPQRYF